MDVTRKRQVWITILLSLFLVSIGASAIYIGRLPERYELLDSKLGPSAWQPTRLLDVLTWGERDPLGLGFPGRYDIQHLALLRLIDLQRKSFGHPAAPRQEDGTGTDSPVVELVEQTASQIVIIGSGTLKPCDQDSNGSYWKTERFTFARSGELLARRAYRFP